MRPAGRGELDSLYFTYPHFAAPDREPARTREATDAVVIVGAGPVGLVAALTLATYGVRSLVIERKATFNDGSRAICIARASFHVLARLGAVDPFLDKALGWTKGRSFYRGRQILEFDMPHSADERFLPMYNLQQQYIEQFLHDAARRSPLIDVRWQSEAVGVAQDATAATLTISDPAGRYDLVTPWLLAADGARSTIRACLGKRLAGDNYEGRYVIADVKMHHDYPTIRRALFDPNCNPGGTVLIHRQPDDIWRIDYQLAEGADAAEATREAVVRRQVAGVLAEIGHAGDWQLEWWSAYSANTLALDDYRDGRVIFIGDSAHIVPIFGVRGLNNGIADAHNIGWKLARVISGSAGASLLDSYTPERRGATLDVFANATKTTRFMTPPTRGWQVLRDAALSLALTEAFARPFADPRQMTPHTYADSPLTTADRGAFAGGPPPGAASLDVRLADGRHLLDEMGPGFTLLLFGTHDAGALERAGRSLDPTIKILSAARAADRYAARPADAYLIRPDLHVAARWNAPTPADVATAIAHALGRPASLP
jgi:3-(3-hydroxy-phenyl)propionate hydroxylase